MCGIFSVLRLTGDARKRFDAREPAWRLLHSAALLQIHRARTRLHAWLFVGRSHAGRAVEGGPGRIRWRALGHSPGHIPGLLGPSAAMWVGCPTRL